MKHAPLMFAALVPLLATAGQGGDLQSKVDPQKLQQDIEASQVIGAELAARDGAQVQDLEISADGRIEAVLIDGMDQSQSADQASRQNASATQGGGSTGTQTQDGLTRVQWDKVSFNAAEDTVSLTSGSQGSSGAMQSQ